MSAVLARDNAKRTPRRTASTAAALMIGVSLVAFLSILASSFKAQITTILEDSFPADISITSQNIGDGGPGTAAFSVSVYNTVKSLPEVQDTTALRYQFEGAKLKDAVIFIAGIDTEHFSKLLKLNETPDAFQKLQDGGIVIKDSVTQENGWKIGDTVQLEFAKTGKKRSILSERSARRLILTTSYRQRLTLKILQPMT